MRVLLLQAGFNEFGVIRALHKMGHYVISIGNQIGLPGQTMVDEYIPFDYSDKEGVLQFVKDHDIDRVLACCNDTAVLTTCWVAEQMGWSGYDSYEAALTYSHKDKFKDFAMKYDVMTVKADSFSNREEALAWAAEDRDYPVIVKPVDLSGGKGVTRCDSTEELKAAIDNAFDISRNGTILIEPFIEGTQHGFCTFLHNKKVIACASNNEHSVVNPYRVEIDTFPANGFAEDRETLISQVELMAEKLDLADGIFHLQYIRSGGKIYILEVMRRIIGNMYSIPAQRSCGFDWDYWEAWTGIGQTYSGDYVDDKKERFVAYRALIPHKDGIYDGITVSENLKKYIFHEEHFDKPGDTLEHHAACTVGMLFMEFNSHEEMMDQMISHYDEIEIHVK